MPGWQKLIATYFVHGYGGSTARDVLLAKSPSLASHRNLVQYYLLGWLCTHYAPRDFVWRAMQQRGNPLRTIVALLEALDCVTALTGAFDQGAAKFPNAPVAPFSAALASALGGGVFRYLERKGRGLDVQTEWASPTGSVQRGVCYIALYALLRRAAGARAARVAVAALYVAVAMRKELGGGDSDPAVKICDAVLALGAKVAATLRLGPPAAAVVASPSTASCNVAARAAAAAAEPPPRVAAAQADDDSGSDSDDDDAGQQEQQEEEASSAAGGGRAGARRRKTRKSSVLFPEDECRRRSSVFGAHESVRDAELSGWLVQQRKKQQELRAARQASE